MITFANQGFERTLDDSANRRIVIPEAFLDADAILSILQVLLLRLILDRMGIWPNSPPSRSLQNVIEGFRLDEEAIAVNVRHSMPSAVLERALMLLTEKGESRQQAHARIRQITLARPNGDLNGLGEALPEVVARRI
jgi:adenylosuccinate lyase